MKLTGRFPSKPYANKNEASGAYVDLPNQHFAHVAQKAVDTLATVTAQKTTNALKCDGWPVVVHRFRPGSVVCTCKLGAAANESGKNTREKTSLHDTNLKVESPAPQVTEGTSSSAQPLVRLNLRGSRSGTLSANPQTYDNPKNVEISKVNTDGLQTFNPSSNGVDMEFDTPVENFPMDTLDAITSISLFNDVDDKPCGICAGAGFTDSYQWVSGKRYTLLPADATFSSPEDANINTTTRPHSIDLFGITDCLWTLHLPTYFETVLCWRVRDNVDTTSDLSLTVDITGTGNGPWLPFSATVFDSLKGVGGKVVVKVTPKNAAMDDITMFTHVEIYVQTNELPFCQFPQLDRDINGSTLEALLQVQFEIDPIVGVISRQSIIEAIGMARLWFVTAVSSKQTAKSYIFNITGSCQVVQPNFNLQALGIQTRWAGKNASTFRGIEREATAGFPNRSVKPYTE